jgi:glutathione synthase/RimK-type ligase-like ATP-grasp enzyme
MSMPADAAVLGLVLRPGSFSDRWLEYCCQEGVSFRPVEPLQSGFLEQVQGLKALAWHWSHLDPTTAIMARQMTVALDAMGVRVFPDTATCWHFDDKIGQAYLLEAIGAPIPENWIFFNRCTALEWVDQAEFPIVHKLRGGAGSANVRLVTNRVMARAICRQAFGRGFVDVPSYFGDAKSKLGRLNSWDQVIAKARRAPAMIVASARARWAAPRTRGYVLFQEFMPGNSGDTRVTVIGNRAFGFVRANRPGDFRASGSGRIDHDPARVDPRCVSIAFSTAGRIASQSMAFDFVFDPQGKPRILEMSYCYQAEAVHNCPGHWDEGLGWHEGHVWPQDAILQDLLNSAGIERTGQARAPALRTGL